MKNEKQVKKLIAFHLKASKETVRYEKAGHLAAAEALTKIL